jgi:hypothetical protein
MNYVANRFLSIVIILPIVIMLSSFGCCVAGYQATTWSSRTGAYAPRTVGQSNNAQKKSFSAPVTAFGADMGAYNTLSRPNQMFYDLANIFWRYDVRIKNAREEIKKFKNCLSIAFSDRTGDCKLTDDGLNEKISLLAQNIAKLTADKNRIMTLQEAFKRSLPVIGAMALLAGGAYLAKNSWFAGEAYLAKVSLNKAEMENLIAKSKNAPLAAEEQERLWFLYNEYKGLGESSVIEFFKKHGMSELYLGHGLVLTLTESGHHVWRLNLKQEREQEREQE